jgi:hypothetical protein
MELFALPKVFEISPDASKLLLELSDKTKQLSMAIQSDASTMEEIVNVDLTEDLRKRMKASEQLYSQLLNEIGYLQNKIKKLDGRFKKLFSSW